MTIRTPVTRNREATPISSKFHSCHIGLLFHSLSAADSRGGGPLKPGYSDWASAAGCIQFSRCCSYYGPFLSSVHRLGVGAGRRHIDVLIPACTHRLSVPTRPAFSTTPAVATASVASSRASALTSYKFLMPYSPTAPAEAILRPGPTGGNRQTAVRKQESASSCSQQYTRKQCSYSCDIHWRRV